MQILSKIDQLISKLNSLKPELSNDPSGNEKKFNEILKSTLETKNGVPDSTNENKLIPTSKVGNGIPSWVDPDYGYDPLQPRKPNMRELMEAISGKDVEELYKEADENWIKISRQASEMLYGVVGPNGDSRDWLSIMTSENILTAAREQTRVMHEPKVDIQSYFNDDGILTEQIAVIKDNKGNTLRSLSSDIVSAEETLLNFGGTKDSIPKNLEERIESEKFDNGLLALLKNFGHKPTSEEQVLVQKASEVIANRIYQEIPLYELAKL